MKSKDCSNEIVRLADHGSFAEPQTVDRARARLDAYEAAKSASRVSPDLEAKRCQVLDYAQKANGRARHLVQVAMAPRMSPALQQVAWQANLAALNRHLGTADKWSKARQEAAAARAWTEQTQNSPSVRSWVLSLDSALAARERGELAGFYRGMGELWEAAAGAGDAHTAAWAEKMVRRWLGHDLNLATHLQALTDQVQDLLLPPNNPLWELIHALARHDRHTAFLATAMDHHLPTLQPSMLQTGASLSRDQAMQSLGQRRWDVSGWTWRADHDLFCLQAPGHAEHVPYTYAMNQTDADAVLGHLQDLADGHWQILGMSCDSERNKLHFLVRTDADHTRSYRFVQGANAMEVLASVERRGGHVCGYARRPGVLQREHMFVVDESHQQSAEHQLIGYIAVSNLPAKISELAAQDWRVAGMVHENDTHVGLVLKRPLATDALTPAQRTQEASHNAAVSQVQQALAARDIPQVQKALAALAALPADLSLWTRHAQALSEAVGSIAEQPWVAAARMAELAQHAQAPLTARSKPFAAALKQLARKTLATELFARRIGPLCEQAAHTPLQGAAQSWLVDCLARAANFYSLPADCSTPTAALPHLVRAEIIGVATVLIAMGANADAVQDGGKTARRLAVELGVPAMSEALEGNTHACAEWARLGAVQRAAIVKVGRAAVELSDAAAPKLLQRLEKLGLDESEALTLRRYAARHAPIWINFRAEASNPLLGDVVYRPRGVGRGRYAGAYDDAGETRVIYSWLNAVDAVVGLPFYGQAALVLQSKLRARATLLARHDTLDFKNVGTFHAMDHVLLRMSDCTLEAMHAAAIKSTALRPINVADAGPINFMEVHIHGPLLLSTDVRAIRSPFGVPDLAHDLRKLQGFAERNGLPLEWHCHTVGGSPRTDADLATACRVDVATMVQSGGQTVTVLHPTTLAVPASYSYALHSERFSRAPRLVELLGREGMDIISLRVDAHSNQVANRDMRRIELLARRDPGDSTPRTYRWQQTFLLSERLQELETNQWEVVAYQQGVAAGQTTPEHFLVARATPTPMHHRLAFLQADTAPTLRAQLNAEVDAQAQGGAKLAGVHMNETTATALFKLKSQLATPANDSTDSDGPTTLLGEPMAATLVALRFTTQAGRVYDIDELAALISTKGQFIDELRQPLSDADVRNIILHPSGAGHRLAALRAETEALQRHIRPATRAQIRAVVAALRADATDGSLPKTTLALDAFRQHVATCSDDEQVALHGAKFTCTDTRNAAFTLTVSEAMAGLQTRVGCSRATAGYLTQIVDTLESLAQTAA